MKTVLIRLAAAALMLGATSASAQMNDHLQCFKIKDAATKAKYKADIASRNTALANAVGCDIKVPAKWLCVEAAKTNTTPDLPGAVTGAPGQTYLCYQTKCPDVPATLDLNDDFGSHTVTASKTGMVCAPVAGTCTDGILNQGEVAIDCGGPCTACSGGGGGSETPCTKNTDCPNDLCIEGFCADPNHCTNNIKDADEPAKDCGGSQCLPCGIGSFCGQDRDCTTDVCESGVCTVQSCSDHHKNQDETGVDCGGTICGDCPLYERCSVDGDCGSGYCFEAGGFCDYAFCHDGMTGPFESGVDCGGGYCTPCDVGGACNTGTDCMTGICDAGTCANPTCADPVNMCGGPCPPCGGMCTDPMLGCGGTCAPCGPGGMCNGPADCFNNNCQAGFCQP